MKPFFSKLASFLGVGASPIAPARTTLPPEYKIGFPETSEEIYGGAKRRYTNAELYGRHKGRRSHASRSM